MALLGRKGGFLFPERWLFYFGTVAFFDRIMHQNYRLVKNQAEQNVIRLMGRVWAEGLSLRQIAGQLNERLVPSKDGGTWQANTVRLILARA